MPDIIEWRPYDRERKAETTPEAEVPVWIHEEGEGVNIGFFDGITFCHGTGVDDTRVTHWAPMTYPEAPRV